MNLKESKEILEALQAAFPSFYRGVPDSELPKIIKFWQEMFSEEPFGLVAAAVKALIATRVEGYPPTIGAVKEQIAKLTQPEQLSELDAWALVNKACQNGYWGFKEEFDKLPEVVQRAVGSPEQLRVWAQMDEDTVNSVVASNFMRTFKVKQKQQREVAMLPPEIRNILAETTKRMALKQPERKPRQLAAPELKPMVLGKPPELPDEKMIRDAVQRSEPYTPPSDEEWERKRDEAMSRLTALKK